MKHLHPAAKHVLGPVYVGQAIRGNTRSSPPRGTSAFPRLSRVKLRVLAFGLLGLLIAYTLGRMVTTGLHTFRQKGGIHLPSFYLPGLDHATSHSRYIPLDKPLPLDVSASRAAPASFSTQEEAAEQLPAAREHDDSQGEGEDEGTGEGAEDAAGSLQGSYQLPQAEPRADKTFHPLVRPVSSVELQMKLPRVALLFLARGEMALEPVWRAFLGSADAQVAAMQLPSVARMESWEWLYSVHIHSGPGYLYSPDSMFHGRETRTVVQVAWGQHSMVSAQKVLLGEALQNPLNARFMLLSDSCVPLYPAPTVYATLLAKPVSAINACKRHGDSQLRMTFRFPYKMSRPYFRRRHWRKSSQWSMLVRKHASLLMNDTQVEKLFGQHCYTGEGDSGYRFCVSDEHYWPSFLASLRLDDETDCRGSLTTATWPGNVMHPHTWTASEVKEPGFWDARTNYDTCRPSAVRAALAAALRKAAQSAAWKTFRDAAIASAAQGGSHKTHRTLLTAKGFLGPGRWKTGAWGPSGLARRKLQGMSRQYSGSRWSDSHVNVWAKGTVESAAAAPGVASGVHVASHAPTAGVGLRRRHLLQAVGMDDSEPELFAGAQQVLSAAGDDITGLLEDTHDHASSEAAQARGATDGASGGELATDQQEQPAGGGTGAAAATTLPQREVDDWQGSGQQDEVAEQAGDAPNSDRGGASVLSDAEIADVTAVVDEGKQGVVEQQDVATRSQPDDSSTDEHGRVPDARAAAGTDAAVEQVDHGVEVAGSDLPETDLSRFKRQALPDLLQSQNVDKSGSATDAAEPEAASAAGERGASRGAVADEASAVGPGKPGAQVVDQNQHQEVPAVDLNEPGDHLKAQGQAEGQHAVRGSVQEHEEGDGSELIEAYGVYEGEEGAPEVIEGQGQGTGKGAAGQLLTAAERTAGQLDGQRAIGTADSGQHARQPDGQTDQLAGAREAVAQSNVHTEKAEVKPEALDVYDWTAMADVDEAVQEAAEQQLDRTQPVIQLQRVKLPGLDSVGELVTAAAGADALPGASHDDDQQGPEGGDDDQQGLEDGNADQNGEEFGAGEEQWTSVDEDVTSGSATTWSDEGGTVQDSGGGGVFADEGSTEQEPSTLPSAESSAAADEEHAGGHGAIEQQHVQQSGSGAADDQARDHAVQPAAVAANPEKLITNAFEPRHERVDERRNEGPVQPAQLHAAVGEEWAISHPFMVALLAAAPADVDPGCPLFARKFDASASSAVLHYLQAVYDAGMDTE